MEMKFSHLDKELFPGITKKDLIEYYDRVSDRILPFIKDRPLTLERYPNGIKGNRFYQKNAAAFFPDWIKTIKIKDTNYVVCNNKETLLYLVNLACIPFHIWTSKIDKLEYPDKMIFDIDPVKADKKIIEELGKGFKFLLEKIKLKPYVMTTGSRGFHIIIPIKRELRHDRVQKLAFNISKLIAKNFEFVTLEQRIEKRENRIFIDTYRNSFSQTAVSPYSVRAIENAPIACPIAWNELKNFNSQKYNIKKINKNPWKDYFKKISSAKKAEEIFNKIT